MRIIMYAWRTVYMWTQVVLWQALAVDRSKGVSIRVYVSTCVSIIGTAVFSMSNVCSIYASTLLFDRSSIV